MAGTCAAWSPVPSGTRGLVSGRNRPTLQGDCLTAAAVVAPIPSDAPAAVPLTRPALTAKERATLDRLIRAPYSLTKPERKTLARLLTKSRAGRSAATRQGR